MAEKDRTHYLDGCCRQLHCAHNGHKSVTSGLSHKYWCQWPCRQRGNFGFSEEEELLWNTAVQDFSVCMQLTMKHNGWKLIHAIWRNPHAKTQLGFTDLSPDYMCYVRISSVEKRSYEDSDPRRTWAGSAVTQVIDSSCFVKVSGVRSI